MQSLKYSIKWYLKRLFPHPLIEILLSIVIIGQYSALKYYDYPDVFIFTSEYLLLPIYGIGIGMHYIRGHSSTVIELSILKSWRSIYLGKFITLLIGFLPILLLDAFILKYLKYESFFIPVSIKIITYIAFTLGASLFESISSGLIVLVTLEFLLPLSSGVVINNLLPTQKLDAILSIIVIFFSPLISSNYSDLLSISLSMGYASSIIISIIILLVSLIVFERRELSP